MLYRIVLVAIALGAAIHGAIASGTIEAAAPARAAGVAVAGIAVGIAVAFAIAQKLHGKARIARYSDRGDDPLRVRRVFCLADYFRLSGIFATIACGIALRRYERCWITLRIVGGCQRFWDVAAFLANALVFFMVGAASRSERLMASPVFTVACSSASRSFAGRVAGLLLPGPYPREWLDVV